MTNQNEEHELMPMIDAFIPKDALTPDAEQRLLQDLTEILIRLEGFEPASQRPREATWVFVHRADVFVAGVRPLRPRYRFIASIPEGQVDDATRAAVVEQVTAAVARAEGGTVEEVSKRVWVFPLEIRDGRWGARGRIQRLPDILAHLVGEHGRSIGEQRLAIRRRGSAALVSSVHDPGDVT